MNLKPVNSINNDSNTIRVSDGNSPIRLIFKDAKGEVINLYDNIDYFYLTKDDDKFYSVTDISYEGDEVIIRLPKLRKGKYKAEIRDKDGSIYPANEDLYILLRRSFEDDKDIYYFGHREDILNSVEPIIIQHIEQNPNKFKGERGQQGFPGRDGLPGIDGKDGKKGDKGDPGDKGLQGLQGIQGIKGEQGIQGIKGDKGDPGLDGKDFDKNSFLVDQTMITDELKQQIAGTAEINAVPADASITNQKLAINAVDFDNINFVKKSSNLFNRGDVTTGKSIDYATGSPKDNATFSLSGYIRVSPNSTYNMVDVGRWGLYKSDFSFISSNTQQSITTTPDTFYMRVAVASVRLGTGQLNRGSIKSYEPYYVELDNSVKTGLIVEPSKNTVDNEAIKEGAVDLTQTTFFRKPNNLFNKFDVIQNRRIDGSGNLVSDNTFVTSNNFQKIEPSTTYSLSNTFVIATYDANENHNATQAITQATGEYTTPANAALVKFSVSKSIYENAMINKDKLLPYEEHRYKLMSTSQFPIEIPSGSGDGGDGSIETSLTYSDKIISEYSENYSGSLPSGSTKLVATINGSLLSKEIYMSTNDLHTELVIEVLMDNGTYKPYKLLSSDGSGEIPITMENLTVHGSTEFLISAWDIVAKQYAFNLREKQFANGIKVSVKNNGSTSVGVTVRVSGGKYA